MCLKCFGSEGLHGYQVVVGRCVPRVVFTGADDWH